MGTLNNRCRTVMRTQKGTIILTTTLLSWEVEPGRFPGIFGPVFSGQGCRNQGKGTWEFPKLRGTVPYFGVLIMRILLFRVLY